MICSHESCTGNHNNAKRENLCPATLEKCRRAQRAYYGRTRSKQLANMARYRTTAKFMLSQLSYETFRRGGRKGDGRET